MSDALAALRAKALNYHPEATYSVCVDRELQTMRAGVQGQLIAAQAARQKLEGQEPDKSATMGERTPEDVLDERIAQLEADLEKVEAEALPNSITLVFRRLPLTADGAGKGESSYEGLLRKMTVKEQINTDALADTLLRRCYLCTMATDGTGHLELTWKQAIAILGRQDITNLRAMIIGHHEIGAAVPFELVNSGEPETT